MVERAIAIGSCSAGEIECTQAALGNRGTDHFTICGLNLSSSSVISTVRVAISTAGFSMGFNEARTASRSMVGRSPEH